MKTAQETIYDVLVCVGYVQDMSTILEIERNFTVDISKTTNENMKK